MHALLATLLLAAGDPTPAPTPASPVENECDLFNREEAARRAHHEGPCPPCPCACGPRGIVCAPCAACKAFGPDPTGDLVGPAKVPPPDRAPGAKKYRVSGRVVSVSRICGGGAAITEEMEAQLPPPQPLVGKALLVVAGEEIFSTQEGARITAGPDGKFDVRLPSGTWCVFDAGRPIPAPDAPAVEGPTAGGDPYVDAACLAYERRRCDEIIRVAKKDITDVQVAFYEVCPQVYNQPCYRGPMPP